MAGLPGKVLRSRTQHLGQVRDPGTCRVTRHRKERRGELNTYASIFSTIGVFFSESSVEGAPEGEAVVSPFMLTSTDSDLSAMTALADVEGEFRLLVFC